LKGIFVIVFPSVRKKTSRFHSDTSNGIVNLREAEKLSRICSQTGIFRGFFLYVYNKLNPLVQFIRKISQFLTNNYAPDPFSYHIKGAMAKAAFNKV